LRIGVVAPPWVPVPPEAYGGIESVLDTLVRGFHDAGHEVFLAAHPASTAPVHLLGPTSAGGAYRMGEVVGETAHVLGAHALLDTVGVDVIHDHTLVGPLLARRPGSPPMVTTNHGPFEPDLRAIFAAASRQAAVVAISHAQAATADSVPIARVIHHGVAVDRFPVGDGTGGYLAFIGRMCPDKGVVEAIDAAQAVGLPLRIAAKLREPEELDYFEAQVRTRLGPDIEFLGELGHGDKVQLLGGAVALCNPVQWEEPFGLVMIEAMACGTPVVTYRRGSAPELVESGRTGWLVDNPADLVDRLGALDVLDRVACRRLVEERFLAERMVDEHLELYGSVIATSSAADGRGRVPDRRLTPPRPGSRPAAREATPGGRAR
jgi:glycosyltransferase involved in cell wall biosynthesis